MITHKTLLNAITAIFTVATVLFSVQAHALQTSTPHAIDSRIKTYVYNRDDVYIYTGHYRYQSSIIFEADEEIVTITMGDTLGWQMVPSGNRLFLKPISPEATTNMTLLTNKRQYLFELYAEEAEDIRDEELTFIARFVYPDSSNGSGFIGEDTLRSFGVANTGGSSDDAIQGGVLAIPEEEINRNYSFSGNAGIAPLEIFDDGEFTYLEFRGKNAELPAIFKVLSDGNESLVNYRIEGPYLVIEQVAQQFTLRKGVDVACVFNESDPLERTDIIIEEDSVSAKKKFFGLF